MVHRINKDYVINNYVIITEIIGEEEEVDEIAWPMLLFDEFLEEAMGLAALLHEILGILELWAENPLKKSWILVSLDRFMRSEKNLLNDKCLVNEGCDFKKKKLYYQWLCIENRPT